MNKTLHLNLKAKWFKMIFLGIKLEEYREISEYWYSRLVDRENLPSIKKASLAFVIAMSEHECPEQFWIEADRIFKGCYKNFETITFSNGYSRDRPQFEIELKGIEIREGNPEWGAEPGKKYFVLNLGEVLSSVNCEEFILKNIE